MRLSALLLTMIFVGGCASDPVIVTEHETIEIFRDRYVEIPRELTQPVENPELYGNFDIYELGAVAKARSVRIEQCNGKLMAIAKIGEDNE